MTKPSNLIEPAVANGLMNPIEKLPADRAAALASISMAISLKRLADVAEQFTDHPDRRNEYGEFGLAALMGELRRFKGETLNDISSFLHRR